MQSTRLTNRIVFVFFGAVLLFAMKKTVAQSEPRPEIMNFGITPYVNDWTRFDDEKQLLFKSPFVKNIMLMFKWSELEPNPEDFKFEETIGNALKTCKKAGKGLGFMIWVGPNAPEWIYRNGVPIVRLTGLGKKQEAVNPYYFSDAYKKYFYRLIDKFCEYISQLPEEEIKNIIYFQVAEGSTGDTRPYKGSGDPTNKDYIISRESWMDFRLDIWRRYKRGLSKNEGTIIPLLFTDDANTDRERDWLLTNFSEFGVKKGHLAHGYNNNFSRRLITPWLALQNKAKEKGVFVFARGEYDNILLNNGWVKKNQKLVFYWSSLAAVHNDIHFWNPSTTIIERSETYEEGLSFYHSHIKSLGNPASAEYAFCAMHSMLDAADTEIFPEKIFGKATRNNPARYYKIIKKFQSNGAQIKDSSKLNSGPMESRKREDDNDIGWDIYAGNFFKYLIQIKPEHTSTAFWNIDSTIYGRFARGFKKNSGKIYLKLDSEFFGDDLGHKVDISVIYKDIGSGSWDLLFFDGAKTQSMGRVQNTDSKRWLSHTFTIPNAVFKGRLEKGADIILRRLKGDNTLFHLIDLKRVDKIEKI